MIPIFILLLLPFNGCLFVAFLAELATTFAVSHLGLRGHRQSRDYRSDHDGSHLGDSLRPRNARKVNIQIMANPPS